MENGNGRYNSFVSRVSLMYQEDLEQLVILLKEELEAGKVKLNSAELLRALARVRTGSNGRIDPNTVSSEVRAMALAAAAARTQRAMKQISLRDVQSEYFDLLDRFFATPFAEMKRHQLDPQTVSQDMARQDRFVNAFMAESEQFAAGIQEFWDYYGPVVELHLRDFRSFKAVFGGDIFPSYTANIACSVGLYADTIVLPDPLHKMASLFGLMSPREAFRLTAKHALNALSYRDIALADVEVPIVVVAPDYLADGNYRSALEVAAESDIVSHCSRMFSKPFSSVNELRDFLKPFGGAEELLSQITDPERLLFDTESLDTLARQFEEWRRQFLSEAGLFPEAGQALEFMLRGRMMQTSDVIFRGARFGGAPLIDAPTSWQYLLWKYEYDADASRASNGNRQELMIANTMAFEGREHGMLSGLPPDALIELRRNGATAELREIIRRGITEIDSASEATLLSVGKQIIENIDSAFSEHDRQLRSLSASRYRFYGVDVGRYVVSGGLSIAAPIAQSVFLAFLASAAALSGPPSPADLWRKFREIQTRSDDLHRSPAGIMFRHLKGKFGFS